MKIRIVFRKIKSALKRSATDDINRRTKWRGICLHPACGWKGGWTDEDTAKRKAEEHGDSKGHPVDTEQF